MTRRYLVIDGRRAALSSGGALRGCIVVDDEPSSARVGVTAVGYVAGLMVTVASNPSGAPLVDVLGLNLRAQIPGSGSTLIPWAALVEGPLPARLIVQARPVGGDGAPTGPYSAEIVVDLENLIDPEALPICISLPTLAFSGSPAVQGSAITATPGVWTGATQGPAVALMRWTPAAGGAAVAVSPLWSVVPPIDGDILLQVGSRVVALDGTVVEAWSEQYRVFDPDVLRTITPGDVAFAAAVYEPGGQTTWWRPRVSFPGLSALSPYAIRWRRPAGAAEPMEHLGSGVYRPVSAAPGDPGADLSYFEDDGSRDIQISWQAASGGPWSAWSASMTMPTLGVEPPVALSLSTAQVRLGAQRSLLTYNALTQFSDYTGGQGVNAPWTTRSIVAVAIAAFLGDTTVYSGGTLPAGGRTAMQRLVDQLKWWAANRVPPGTMGYASQYQSAFVICTCIAMSAPNIWGQLTDGEKRRLDLALKGSFLAACFITGDKNPFYPGGQPNERTIRGFAAGRSNVPNFCASTRLAPFLIAHVLGASAMADFLNTWTRAAFVAEIESAYAAYIPGSASARCDLWETFRRQWTDAVQVAMHGANHGGLPGPSEAQIRDTVRDWSLSYNDQGGAGNRAYRLSEGARFLPTEIRRCCSREVKPGLGPNLQGAGATVYGIMESNSAVPTARNAYVGRMLNMADAASLPNWNPTTRVGAMGMWRELDDRDGGRAAPRSVVENVRSTISYTLDGYSVLTAYVAAFVVLGLANRSDPQMASAMARFQVATTDFRYKLLKGYRDVAKGGRPSANNSDFPAGSLTGTAQQSHLISVAFAMHDEIIQPWFAAA